jgi:poly(ADP-ribose) glycohydrolase
MTRKMSDKSFVLPCSPSILRLDRFDVVSSDEPEIPFWRILSCILAESLNSVMDSSSLIDILETISVVLHGEAARNYEFLTEFLDKYLTTSTTGPSKFFLSTWPRLVRLALQLPSLFPTHTIPLLKNDENSQVILSRRQVACLVVHQFLCSLPAHPWQTESFVNLSPWYSAGEAMHQGAVQAYLTALFTYFEAIEASEPNSGVLHHSVEDWPIIFTLIEMPEGKSPSLLCNAPATLSRLTVIQLPHQSTDLPYLGLPDGACVISANKCVGLGATGTQEELHVGISPEAYPVSLLAPPLKDRQVLVCQGAEAMVTTKGHGRWASLDEVLHTRPRSSSANWRNRIMLFMDALELDLVDLVHPHGGGNIPDLMPGYLHRELAKAYTAFSSHYYSGNIRKPYSFVTTGHWGCGAFGGNKQVKAIIQWYAASMANVPELRYVLGDAEQKRFGDELIKFVDQVIEHTRRGLEPRELFDVLVRLGKDIQNGKSCVPDPDEIFEYVLKGL